MLIYAFRDMVLNCAGIAYYLESHASVESQSPIIIKVKVCLLALLARD